MSLLETLKSKTENEVKIADQTVLPKYRERLLEAAREAARTAYCPHSNFRVEEGIDPVLLIVSKEVPAGRQRGRGG